jgi:lipopolysaccharide biosynthesis glycosyltransferase
LIPSLINESRVIYIDADTLVVGDLTDLYQMGLGSNLLAGVLDPAAVRESKIPRRADDPYINAGVLLLDLDALRNDDMLEKSTKLYHQYVKEATWLDQCIINKYAENRKTVLDRKWNSFIFSNMMKDSEFTRIVSNDNPAILHFIGPVKPWQDWCNPDIAAYWWRVADEIKIETLKKQPITNITNAISFAKCLDLSEKYQQASLYKDKIINILLQHT